MYDDLVKRLKYAASYDERIVIETCKEAADAVEELSKLADAIPHACECCVGCELEKKNGGCDNAFVLSPKRAMQYLIKPRWIPVTERLPKKNEDVLVYLWDRQVPYLTWVDTEGRWETNDFFIDIEDEPKAWMPLPKPYEPPKEGIDNDNV